MGYVKSFMTHNNGFMNIKFEQIVFLIKILW